MILRQNDSRELSAVSLHLGQEFGPLKADG
jgi:hypothetical protein